MTIAEDIKAGLDAATDILVEVKETLDRGVGEIKALIDSYRGKVITNLEATEIQSALDSLAVAVGEVASGSKAVDDIAPEISSDDPS